MLYSKPVELILFTQGLVCNLWEVRWPNFNMLDSGLRNSALNLG